MFSTGLVLSTTCSVIYDHGIYRDGPELAAADGRLHVATAVYRAVTGATPASSRTWPALAQTLIESNPVVMDAIRWISAVLPSMPPIDTATGADDYLAHLDRWLDETDSLTGRRPNVFDVIGVLVRAEQTADALTTAA
jgi:hypothetical protein